MSSLSNSRTKSRGRLPDYLGPLIEHLNDDANISEDIENVARNLNQYLVDERLYEVHPETLFKILMRADPQEYDQQLFVNFVMKLFEEEPEKAIPLTLMMNFDLLTLDQIEDIFQCREMHDQALGYFIAASLSETRNKQELENDKTDHKHTTEISDIKSEIKKRRAIAMAKVQKEFEQQKKEILEIIEQQRIQIAKLTKLKEHQDDKINNNVQTFAKMAAKLDREIMRQKALLRKKKELLAKRRERILDEFNNQGNEINREMTSDLNEIARKNQSKLDYIRKKLNPEIKKIVRKSDALKDSANNINQKINEATESAQESRAVLAAKIVHDQVRFNQFLRDMNKRFDAFKSDPKIWDLDVPQVEEAEKLVIKLEKQISASCPINIRQQMKTSVEAFQMLGNLFSGKINAQ